MGTWAQRLRLPGSQDFPGGASGKEPACQCRRHKRHGFNTWMGKISIIATHSSILPWRILWTKEPGRLQSIGSQRVGHDWSGLAHKRFYRKKITKKLIQFSFQHISRSLYKLEILKFWSCWNDLQTPKLISSEPTVVPYTIYTTVLNIHEETCMTTSL